MNQLQQYAALLQQIEQELRDNGLWASKPPSPHALASRMPFCVDTLKLEQWLQFIFIPKMRAIIDNNQLIPQVSGIAPLAEEVYQDNAATKRLVSLLARFDQLSAQSRAH